VSWNPTDEQLELLKTGWTVEGLSAGQLASTFGVTRNVVMGIVHRRGWIQPGGGAPRARRAPQPARQVAPPKPLPPPKKTKLELDPSKFVAFDQLGPHHCRYPVDEGGQRGMYCGATPNESPYCDGHAAIVYQPQQPRKIKRPR
jgi:GcrA cell cycle regulator